MGNRRKLYKQSPSTDAAKRVVLVNAWNCLPERGICTECRHFACDIVYCKCLVVLLLFVTFVCH